MDSSLRIEAIAEQAEIIILLEQCGLPVADIAVGSTQEFFGIRGDLLVDLIVRCGHTGQAGSGWVHVYPLERRIPIS